MKIECASREAGHQALGALDVEVQDHVDAPLEAPAGPPSIEVP